jgi:hypothetical protein
MHVNVLLKLENRSFLNILNILVAVIKQNNVGILKIATY